MLRRYTTLYSPAIGRDMELLSFGHYGVPIIFFPTGGGTFYEAENHGLINGLTHLLDNAKIKIYCPESIDDDTWLHSRMDPHWRAIRHHAYQDFIVNNLVRHIRADCEDDQIKIGLVGVGFGGYHAINFALKYPAVFEYGLGLSGRYDMDTVCGEKSESVEVYYNNPIAYLPNLEGEELELIRENTQITMVCGQGMWDEQSVHESRRIAEQLEEKDIPHEFDLWGFDVTPDWYWWQKQMVHHLSARYDPD